MPKEKITPSKATPLINNFQAGELDPALDARSDFKKYYSGCITLENFVPILEGGVTRMPGSHYIAALKGTVIPPTPWVPPAYSDLWAYFKHDEGSGLEIVDYSPLLENGVLTQPGFSLPADATQQAYWWDTNPGFGTSSGSWTYCAKSTRAALASRNIAYSSIVAFIKPLEGTGFFNSDSVLVLGENGYIMVGWRDIFAPYYWKLNGAVLSETHAPEFGTWYCVYASVPRSGTHYLKIRKSGDEDWATVVTSSSAAGAGIQSRVATVASMNNTSNCVFGDVLWYASMNPTALLTDSEATEIYNELKSRYGMV